MRYFEFDDPYYALVRAENVNNACATFERVIGTEHHVKPAEKTRNEALNLFLLHEDTKGEKDFGEMIREFNHDSEAVLLLDRGLI